MQLLQSMFDLTSSTQAIDGTSQMDHATGAYIPYSLHFYSHSVTGSFNIPFQLMCKDEGDKANGLLLPPNDMNIWTGKGFKSQLAWSHQCFKDLG